MIYTEADTTDRYLDGNVTELTFKGFNGNCKFEIHDLKVNKDIDYDECTLFINDEEFDPGKTPITNWRGDTPDPVLIFEQVLNAYFRDDESDFTFGEGWNIFDSVKNMAEITDGVITLLPQYDGFDVIFYECELVTSEGMKYYIQDDLCLLLGSENQIETDVESFYMSAWDEDVERILNGDLAAIYTGDEFEYYVDNYE